MKGYQQLFGTFILLITVSTVIYGQETPPISTLAETTQSNSKTESAVTEISQTKQTKMTAEEKAVETDNQKSSKKKKKEFSEAIADNSFYIEEAYNQEKDVMQTINTCAWFRRPSNDVFCTITQEFPLINQKHQISYTAPYSFVDSNRTRGFGDVSLNYRYQLTGDNSWATIAPRISLIVPSGKRSSGLGSGSGGVQFNLPVSKRISEAFAGHFNAGLTYLPKAKGEDALGNTVSRGLTNYNVGGSFVWLAHKRFNALFEFNENFVAEINEHGRINRFQERIINPGFRLAIDIGGLQIVPGIGVPTSFSRGETRTGVFFYLSFEHPFKKQKVR